MAAYFHFQRRRRQLLRRNRIFRDRTHPFEVFDDEKVLRKFRLHRQSILDLTDTVRHDLEHPLVRRGALTPVLQVLLTLRFYATGTFQDVIADLIGVDTSTASRTISRVTDALLPHVRRFIKMPSQPAQLRRTKEKFFAMRGFPNVIGCIDGTHIRIQAPREREYEFVNRRNFHSMNVQVSYVSFNIHWEGGGDSIVVVKETKLLVAKAIINTNYSRGRSTLFTSFFFFFGGGVLFFFFLQAKRWWG